MLAFAGDMGDFLRKMVFGRLDGFKHVTHEKFSSRQCAGAA